MSMLRKRHIEANKAALQAFELNRDVGGCGQTVGDDFKGEDKFRHLKILFKVHRQQADAFHGPDLLVNGSRRASVVFDRKAV